VQTILDLEDAHSFDCLTEGGGDFGVDAMHISEEYDGEFTVSLFQVKYVNNLEGKTNFPENGITALINAIRFLFDPTAKLEHINQRLLAKVEEARSLIRDGYIPQVRALACNNGIKWNASSQEAIIVKTPWICMTCEPMMSNSNGWKWISNNWDLTTAANALIQALNPQILLQV
jgi:hypothetical protein